MYVCAHAFRLCASNDTNIRSTSHLLSVDYTSVQLKELPVIYFLEDCHDFLKAEMITTKQQIYDDAIMSQMRFRDDRDLGSIWN
jgi:hypothetical protein